MKRSKRTTIKLLLAVSVLAALFGLWLYHVNKTKGIDDVRITLRVATPKPDPHYLDTIVVRPSSCSIKITKRRQYSLPVPPSSSLFLDRKSHLIFQSALGVIRYDLSTGKYVMKKVPPGWKLVAIDSSDDLYFRDASRSVLAMKGPKPEEDWEKQVPGSFLFVVDYHDLGYVWPVERNNIEMIARTGLDAGTIPFPEMAMDQSFAPHERFGLVVADSSLHSLTFLDRGGFQRGIVPKGWEPNGDPNSMLNYPWTVAVDANGQIWAFNANHASNSFDVAVVDVEAGRFARFDPSKYCNGLKQGEPPELAFSPAKSVFFCRSASDSSVTEYAFQIQFNEQRVSP